MRRILFFTWPVVVFLILLGLSMGRYSFAESVRLSGRLSPSDYLLGSQEQRRDPVFDKYRTIELGLNLGVGSDCGRIDFKGTLQASLKNVLDAKYFEDLGKDILAASPMLITCYFSPTWCAILKHSQVSAHWLSQMRLDQCSLIDKYVDSRVEDYYQERQSCVRRAIDRNGGDLEHAMESCRGNNLWQADLADWSGASGGRKAGTNRLIGSSAQWAGLDGADAEPVLNLVKALVGDTVVSRGQVSVEYGPRRAPMTPRTYLQSIEKATHDKLCGGLLRRIEEDGGRSSVDRLVTEQDLRDLAPSLDGQVVDRQTLRSIALMPTRQRTLACRKLADAVAMSVFSADVNRSLDVLTTLSQNPNLPAGRKAEIEQKRQALKEQVEMTVGLSKQRNEPLNAVLAQINDEGRRLSGDRVTSDLGAEASRLNERRARMNLMDCADGILCEGREGER